MTSDLCNKYKRITTSYILCTVIHLGFSQSFQWRELQSFILTENIVCISKRLSLKTFLNHWMAGMIIGHYLE